jgi:hypothetical protein
MDGEWYCSVGGKEIGPLSPHQLRAMAESGGLMPTDRVRRGATGNWVHASQVKGLFATPPSPSPPGAEMRAVHASLDDNANPMSVDVVAHRSTEGSALPSLVRRRHQQQQRLVGSLAVVGVGMVIALLILIFGRGGETDQDRAATGPRKTAGQLKGAFGAKSASPADKPLPPAATPASSKDSDHKSTEAQTKRDSGGNKAKKADAEPLRSPTGKPEDDFGIRPDEVSPQAPSPPAVKKNS